MRSLENSAVIDALRARVASIEGVRGAAAPVAPLGVPAIDGALPGGGLMCGAVHEVVGGAAIGFAAMASGRMAGPVLWCVDQQAHAHLYGPGLAAFGLGPDRLVVACCANRTDMLWAMEEGLRTTGLAAVVGEPGGAMDLTASRRLQLAAEIGGALGLVLAPGAARRSGFAPSALASRWRVESAPSGQGDLSEMESRGGESFGRPRWRIALEQYRAGLGSASGDGSGNRITSGDWVVTWREESGCGESRHEQTCRFSVDDAAFDRSPESRSEPRLAG